MKIIITPSPYLAHSLRFTNHNNKTAIADIIDNSIDAEAENIWIKVNTENGEPILRIIDDGRGMTKETLIKAITYGNHMGDIDGSLGKFGMGLKSSAGHLGDILEVITKIENSTPVKGVVDFSKLPFGKEWEADIFDEISLEEKKLVEETLNDGSGTIVTIKKNRYPSNTTNFANSIRKYLGRTFRYFLSPPNDQTTDGEKVGGKIKMFLNDDEIYGVDPLERQLKSTQIRFDCDIDLGDSKSVNAVVVYLDPNECGSTNDTSVDDEDDDITKRGNFNYTPSIRHQGVYVVRNNREIMAADATIFKKLWRQKHNDSNYCRIELRYTDLDDIFPVNHDKCGLKDIEQRILDILTEKLRKIVGDARKYIRSLRNSSDIETQELHNKVSDSISSKKSVLDLPKGKKQKRIKIGKKEGSVIPVGTGKKRYGKRINPNSKTNAVEVGVCDYGTAGQLFDYEITSNDKLKPRWNTSHPYYQKYVRGQSKDQVYATDLFLFAVASKLCKKEQELGDVGAIDAENFIESVSMNLRALSQ